MSTILDKITAENEKAEVPQFEIGDGVKVSIKIKEGDKERIQIFAGTVIARDGDGAKRNFHGSPHIVWHRRREGLPGSFTAHREGGSRALCACPPREAVLPARP